MKEAPKGSRKKAITGKEKAGRKGPAFVVKYGYDKHKITTKRLYAR
jgi:hypothetical protein